MLATRLALSRAVKPRFVRPAVSSWISVRNREAGEASSNRPYYTYSSEPFHPLPGRTPAWKSPEEAVQVIKSGMKVFVHSAAATPIPLVEAMAKWGKKANLQNVEVIHIHIEGNAEHTKEEYEGIFRDNSFFIGANCRKAINDGRADCTPIFLSEIPLVFHRNLIELDVALIQVSPPDKHGFCTLGPSVDVTRAALQNAKYIIGLVNPQCPRTQGPGGIHQSHLDVLCVADFPLPEHKTGVPSEQDRKIGKYIAENLVADGATLQMGIGSIPDCCLAELMDHKDLGIHSEMFSDGVVDLVERGAVTNAKKKILPGRIVGSFVIGTKKVFEFIDNNPFVVMLDVGFVNLVAISSQNPKMTAINSCIEVDLTGQVVSDSIGTRMYSGVGGQVDFLRGAALGYDGLGKPILALNSTTSKGESKIVPFIKQGAGVVTTRAHVHYVVTEYGIAQLFGKNLRQRAYELIRISHPKHREELEKASFDRLKCMPSPD
ncbi:predicted protein [Nematostella vectensis]|uniref:Uncharacterized protein n=1 Tax=Nematostella vectensis TaxID=45351 RepID=A7SYK6_NEMVE|nr:4-hydroxybutyrate coenzyme A transferase [Nematostella vectensis]EDO31214.1 predicted protein [Nematostella vectensis]|eukprot:XP_001623314.1 predicted protein [Nematostella vectensis]